MTISSGRTEQLRDRELGLPNVDLQLAGGVMGCSPGQRSVQYDVRTE